MLTTTPLRLRRAEVTTVRPRPELRDRFTALRLLRWYLAVNGVALLVGATVLAWLPERLIESDAYDVIFRWVPRQAWAAVFAAVGLVALWGAARQAVRCTRLALVGLLGLQATWAVGLTAPIFLEGQASALAPLTWAVLTATSGTIMRVTGGLRGTKG